MMQPKPFLNNLRLRNHAKGNERRLNMSKIILDKGTPLPLPVTLEDIDTEFNKWVEEDLEIAYNGKKLPTYKLLSQHQINEYAQTWQHLDETNNIVMNFKTITRDNNPKKGTNQGEMFNVPGNRDYTMFSVPILQENGLEAYDVYSMKQPFSIDLLYKVGIICNKYELLNEMNQLMHDKFKAINCYIAPNKHFMPMVLEDITDESEYNVDDRRYYSQIYTIRLKAYIIKQEDFKVTKIPSRMRISMVGLNTFKKSKTPKVQVVEDYVADDCCLREEKNPYYNRKTSVNVDFPICTRNVEFTIDQNFVLLDIKTDNVYDFVLRVNNEVQSLEYEVNIENGDNIKIEIERDDLQKESSLSLIGYNPNEVLDERYNPESSLDEKIQSEEINIKHDRESSFRDIDGLRGEASQDKREILPTE